MLNIFIFKFSIYVNNFTKIVYLSIYFKINLIRYFKFLQRISLNIEDRLSYLELETWK